ncbi:MAG: hypothetical protein K0U36_04775, partial [Alphaproteobacteria bacterium]|nr:hypothetical protein [Alphaproteobacteria bacterium]
MASNPPINPRHDENAVVAATGKTDPDAEADAASQTNADDLTHELSGNRQAQGAPYSARESAPYTTRESAPYSARESAPYSARENAPYSARENATPSASEDEQAGNWMRITPLPADSVHEEQDFPQKTTWKKSGRRKLQLYRTPEQRYKLATNLPPGARRFRALLQARRDMRAYRQRRQQDNKLRVIGLSRAALREQRRIELKRIRARDQVRLAKSERTRAEATRRIPVNLLMWFYLTRVFLKWVVVVGLFLLLVHLLGDGVGGGGAGGYRASGYGPSPLQGTAQSLGLGTYAVT